MPAARRRETRGVDASAVAVDDELEAIAGDVSDLDSRARVAKLARVAPLTVAVLGLGEAGSAIAGDLVVAGVSVRGFDPAAGAAPAGVELAADASAAAAGSEVVLSVNAAAVAVEVARSAVGGLGEGQVYADLNTAAPALKRAVAEVVAPTGAAFADVALMAPVPGRGLRTPALVSGPAAEQLAARLGPLGMPIEVLGADPGAAATRKLLRSVFMKGFAAACIESMRAARAAGCEDWMRAEIADVLTSADAALLDRLLAGSERHATRRVHEVRDARELLTELGVEPRVAAAAEGWLSALEREGAATADASSPRAG
jgi:3-hydroxyisobutyrate dehydrogenase-like beta-hydroxyacid dehydrogenase